MAATSHLQQLYTTRDGWYALLVYPPHTACFVLLPCCACVCVYVQNATACMMTPDCYQAALDSHLLLLRDEAAVEALLDEQPHSLDAVVVFSHAAAAATTGQASAPPLFLEHPATAAARVHASDVKKGVNRERGSKASGSSGRGGKAGRQKQLVGCGAPGPPDGDGLLLDYVIRMNSSDVPPTQLLQDLFDVSPGVMPLPGNLLW